MTKDSLFQFRAHKLVMPRSLEMTKGRNRLFKKKSQLKKPPKAILKTNYCKKTDFQICFLRNRMIKCLLKMLILTKTKVISITKPFNRFLAITQWASITIKIISLIKSVFLRDYCIRVTKSRCFCRKEILCSLRVRWASGMLMDLIHKYKVMLILIKKDNKHLNLVDQMIYWIKKTHRLKVFRKFLSQQFTITKNIMFISKFLILTQSCCRLSIKAIEITI